MGSKILIWKQDPSVPLQGVRATFIHSEVRPGPSDDELVVEMRGQCPLAPGPSGDFLFDRDQEPEQFDAAHTFAVARQVLTMYQRALRRVGCEAPFHWRHGEWPLKLQPRGSVGERQIRYRRGDRALIFSSFPWPQGCPTEVIHTCRSFDLIAHELGHAILDAIQPEYYEKDRQTGALAESFADLAAIFTPLAQMDQVETMIAESKADLRQRSFLTTIAEQYGRALKQRQGLRTALNMYRADQTFDDIHELSQVFTGAVYDVLVETFENEKDFDRFDPAETLFRAARHVLDLVISAFLAGPAQNAQFRDIAELIVRHESDHRLKAAFTRVFELRKIL